MNFVVENISTAVALLHEDQSREALLLLAKTLRQLLDQADALSNECGEISMTDACHVYSVDTMFESELAVPPDSSCSFYHKAFSLKVLDGTTDPELFAKSWMSQLTVIIIYNMALIHHQEGILRGSSKLLRKASALYRPALAVLRECSTMGIFERTILLAITNNLGHIHSMNCELKEVKECQGLMAELVQAFLSNPESLQGEEDFLPFFLGSLCFVASGPRAAPAA